MPRRRLTIWLRPGDARAEAIADWLDCQPADGRGVRVSDALLDLLHDAVRRDSRRKSSTSRRSKIPPQPAARQVEHKLEEKNTPTAGANFNSLVKRLNFNDF